MQRVTGGRFTLDPATYAFADTMDGVGVPANERMPVWQRLAFSQSAVGAGLGEPGRHSECLGRQRDAVGNLLGAIRVVPASASILVKEPARDIGIVDSPGVLVFVLVNATLSAAVAERLPFAFRHLLEGKPLPEWGI
jgi:hypothetical protein